MTTKINPSEISSIIKKKIDGYKGAATEANVGEVLTTADGIVQIFGLEDAMYGELLDFGRHLWFGAQLGKRFGWSCCAWRFRTHQRRAKS